VALVGLALWTSEVSGGAADDKAPAPVAPAQPHAAPQAASAAVSVAEIAARSARGRLAPDAGVAIGAQC